MSWDKIERVEKSRFINPLLEKHLNKTWKVGNLSIKRLEVIKLTGKNKFLSEGIGRWKCTEGSALVSVASIRLMSETLTGTNLETGLLQTFDLRELVIENENGETTCTKTPIFSKK